MEPLERFVAGLSDEQFDYLNRNRAFSRQLLDEYELRNRAQSGDPRALARVAGLGRSVSGSFGQPQTGFWPAARAAGHSFSFGGGDHKGFSSRPQGMARLTGVDALASAPDSKGETAPDGVVLVSGGVANPKIFGHPAPGAPPLPKLPWKLPRIPRIGRLPGYAGIAVEIWNLLATIMNNDDAESPNDEAIEEKQSERRERGARCAREFDRDMRKCSKQWKYIEEMEQETGEDLTKYKNGTYRLCSASAKERLHQCNKYGKAHVPLQVIHDV